MISRILFESPLLLVLCWIPVQIALLLAWAWARARTPTHARLFWIGVAALPALLLLQGMVHTDREQIIDRCRALAKFVTEDDIPSIEKSLSPGFRADQWDRDSFVDRVESVLKRNRIERPSLRGFAFSLSSDMIAIVEFTASANVVTSSDLSGRVSARFQLTFIKHGDDWLIQSIEILPIPTSPIRSLDDITSR